MSYHVPAGRVPVEPLRPLLQEHMEHLGAEMDKNQYALSPIGLLAMHAGMIEDSLRRIMTRTKTVEFDVADRLLCAMDKPHLWYEHPVLSRTYQEIDLRTQKERLTKDCEVCGGTFVALHLTTRFCSRSCSSRANGFARG
jgi:hypothetical protein